MTTIVILSAAANEIEPFFSLVSIQEKIQKGVVSFVKGNFAQHTLILGITGVGLVNSSTISTLAISWFKPDLLLFCGVAGGISPEVNTGDVVVANEVTQSEHFSINTSFLETPFAHYLNNPHHNILQPEWLPSLQITPLEMAPTNYPIHYGRIVSTDQFPAPMREYALLLRENVLAIDMETFGMYQAGWLTGVPTIGVRGISNTLLEDGTDPDMQQADITQVPQHAAQVCLGIIAQL